MELVRRVRPALGGDDSAQRGWRSCIVRRCHGGVNADNA
jgi:hypothetical protein